MAKYIKLDFKKYSDDSLLAFAVDVHQRMNNNPNYAPEQDQVTLVGTAVREFETAVSNASEGGRTLKLIRTEKRDALLRELQVLAMRLDLYMDKDPAFFTATGFLLRKKPVRNEGPIPRAILKFVRRGQLSGTVDGETANFPNSVKQLAVEYSNDNGATWHNSTYSTGKRFRLEGLAPRQDYLIRTCFHGTRQRSSDWSEALGVFVL